MRQRRYGNKQKKKKNKIKVGAFKFAFPSVGHSERMRTCLKHRNTQ